MTAPASLDLAEILTPDPTTVARREAEARRALAAISLRARVEFRSDGPDAGAWVFDGPGLRRVRWWPHLELWDAQDEIAFAEFSGSAREFAEFAIEFGIAEWRK
mgnify:CR=1 FL=1